MALTLYTDGFFISPYAFSGFVALEEKGLPYQIEPVQAGTGGILASRSLFGASGMLGHRLMSSLAACYSVTATVRTDIEMT